MFIAGWVLWFVIDKHPASLGVYVPGESGNLLNNFQLAFDMMKAGYLKAAFVFLWKTHYLVLSLVAGLVSSMVFQTISNSMRRRKLRQVMRPNMPASDNSNSDE